MITEYRFRHNQIRRVHIVEDPCWEEHLGTGNRLRCERHIEVPFKGTRCNLNLLQKQRMWWRWIISQVQEGFYEAPPMKLLSNALCAMSDNGWLMDAQTAIDRFWVNPCLSKDEREARSQAEKALYDLDFDFLLALRPYK